MISRHRPALALWLTASMLPFFLVCLAAVALPTAWSQLLAPSSVFSSWLGLMAFLAIALPPRELARLEPSGLRGVLELALAAQALALPGAALALHASLTSSAAAAPALGYLAALAALSGLIGGLAARRGASAKRLSARGLVAAGALMILGPFLLWLRALFVDSETSGAYWPGLALAALTEDASSWRPWLGLLMIGLAGYAALLWEGRRRRRALAAAAAMGALLVVFAEQRARAQGAPPIEILSREGEALLGSRVRPGFPVPLRLKVGREQSGEWRGELAARVGERRYAAEVSVPGRSQASPVTVELAPVFLGRESLVFEARDERGATRLSRAPWSPELLDKDRVLCAFLGAKSREFAETALRESSGFAPLLPIERDRLSDLARAGSAVDAVFVAKRRESDLPALSAFAAQGGAVVFEEPLVAGRGLLSLGAARYRRIGRGLFLGWAGRKAPEGWLDAVMTLLDKRFKKKGRGRLRDTKLSQTLASAPSGGDARFGWRALIGVTLAYLALLAGLWGLSRQDAAPGVFLAPGLALAVAALGVTLALRWLVLSPAVAMAERWRIEDRAAGSDLSALTTYLRLESLRSEDRLRVPMNASGPVLLYFSAPSDQRRCRAEFLVGGAGPEMLLELESGSGRVLRWSAVGRRPGGPALSRGADGRLVLSNAGELILRDVMVVEKENGAWLGELPPGASRSLPAADRPWSELVERFEETRRRLVNRAIEARLDASPASMIIAVIDDPEPAVSGKATEERSLGRVLVLSWLDAELK